MPLQVRMWIADDIVVIFCISFRVLVKLPSSSDVFLFYGALMLGMFVVYVMCACLWDEKKFYCDSYSSHIKPAN